MSLLRLPEDAALRQALQDNNFFLVDLMIAEGADPDAKDPATEDCPLHEVGTS